ncbi:alpha/beta fold hydrolase [Nocardioides flavescens]|uniref:Alpha/beta fold hydrolase n=1 Tax=Nocardioides flavescens TaxID=2691959 RepID=A0A6L7F1C6_9ACTN|nr:alpha/beta fold hydrolase [Nocardioides flavescens]MXG91175.1 alpha/beta fold hydrolase [Nocardioides flavescens]
MTLVLLHGLGVDAAMFDDLRDRLTGPTVAFDLPGHGAEPALPEGAGLEAHAAWLAERLASQEDGPVDLLGVSLGGLLAQQLAATRPDLVRRLVVVDAVTTYPEPMRAMWRERAAVARTDGVAAYVEPTLALWFTAEAREADEPVVAWTAKTVEGTSPEGYARACELLEGADTRPLLDRITQPVLVVCGDDDAPPFRAAVAELEAALTDVRTCWLPGRHAAVIESPEPAVAALEEFLSTPDPQPEPQEEQS